MTSCGQEEEDPNAALLKDLADLIDEQSEIENQQQRSNSVAAAAAKESAMLGGGSTSSSTTTEMSNPFSKMSSIVPKELLGPLVMEALNGFMFLMNDAGRIDVISDNVSGFLGRSQADMEGNTVYNFIHPNDHSRFRFSLLRGLDGSLPSGGGDSFLKSKVFTVRFARQPEHSGGGGSALTTAADGNPDVLKYEMMQVSTVAIKASDPPKMVDGRDLSGSRLFCVARKVSRSEKNQHFPVEQFTTKLDTNNNFNIVVLDTTGMDQIHATSITRVMLNHSLVDFVHPDDKEVLVKHLNTCVSDGTNVSPVYRMNLLGNRAEYVHVKTKSRFFKACLAARNPSDFMNSTHSIIGETELRRSDLPGSRYQQQQSPSSVISSGRPELSLSPPNNNNLIKNSNNAAAAASSSEVDAQQKNLLLKQLLNVNFSRSEDETSNSSSSRLGPMRGSSSGSPNNMSAVGSSSGNNRSSNNPRSGPPSPPANSNSRILQLLSKNTDNVPRTSSSSAAAAAAAASRAGVLSPNNSHSSNSSSSNPSSVSSPGNNNPPAPPGGETANGGRLRGWPLGPLGGPRKDGGLRMRPPRGGNGGGCWRFREESEKLLFSLEDIDHQLLAGGAAMHYISSEARFHGKVKKPNVRR